MIEAIFTGLVVWALTSKLEERPALPEWDQRPPGTGATALSIRTVRGPLSGAVYRVSTFGQGSEGTTYTVARRLSNRDWIGFLTARSGERAFWRADAATQSGMDVLRRDWGI